MTRIYYNNDGYGRGYTRLYVESFASSSGTAPFLWLYSQQGNGGRGSGEYVALTADQVRDLRDQLTKWLGANDAPEVNAPLIEGGDLA